MQTQTTSQDVPVEQPPFYMTWDHHHLIDFLVPRLAVLRRTVECESDLDCKLIGGVDSIPEFHKLTVRQVEEPLGGISGSVTRSHTDHELISPAQIAETVIQVIDGKYRVTISGRDFEYTFADIERWIQYEDIMRNSD